MGPNEIRIANRAAGVNRADLLQRAGHYPPPPGASEILGLECAGEVVEVGAGVNGWSRGDRAMALLAGGGYANEVIVDAGSAMHVPDALSDIEAAAIPEVFLTAYSNIFLWARAQRGERVLIHGGGSGVGTAAITLCKVAGMFVIATAGSDEKCKQCVEHGADLCINYKTEDFVAECGGADVILDHLGAVYLPRDLQALNAEGRVVIIGSMGGERMATIDVTSLLGKRQQIIGSTLRARPIADKARIVSSFLDRFGEDLNALRVRPVIDAVFDIADIDAAHERVRADHFGKVVLRLPARA